jgi:hypothetical protein
VQHGVAHRAAVHGSLIVDVHDVHCARHVLVVEGANAGVGLAKVGDSQVADAYGQRQQDAEAAHQPGHCVEILKPVHVKLLHFPLLD